MRIAVCCDSILFPLFPFLPLPLLVAFPFTELGVFLRILTFIHVSELYYIPGVLLLAESHIFTIFTLHFQPFLLTHVVKVWC